MDKKSGNEATKELMDFSYHELGTTIESDTTIRDDYPLTNLISSSRELKKQGFLAESFVRPPITFSIHFNIINKHDMAL